MTLQLNKNPGRSCLGSFRLSRLGWRLLLLCVCLLQAGGNLYGQNQTAIPASLGQGDHELDHELTEALQGLVREWRLPALWVGRFRTDGDVRAACSGVRKVGEPSVVELDDVLHLGSCTKAMTAALIAKLCTEGRFAWDSPLAEIFPDEPLLCQSEWSNVTVVELLEHRSGAPANASWHSLDSEHAGDVVAARRGLLRWLAGQSRPQGSAFVYSNVGYALLGHIIEECRQDSWEEVMKRELFEPLAMSSAGFGPVGSGLAPDDVSQPWGHVNQAGSFKALGGGNNAALEKQFTPRRLDNSPSLGPAGRVHASLSDWAKFVLLTASRSGGARLGINDENWSQVTGGQNARDYAGGWMVTNRKWAGGRTLYHNGSNTTWYCVAWVAPEKGICLLAATNAYSEQADAGCDAAVQLLLRE
jgi:CubicO group peptidase (beta-lactamase class C family)